MAKSIDTIINELKENCKNNTKPDENYIKKLIKHRNGLVVSWAAKCVSTFNFKELIEDLITAFTRLQKNGVKVDKACLAKNGIIKALNSMDYDYVDFYINASSLIQIEQSIDGKIDKATNIRIACIEAFNRFEWHRIARTLAKLSGDAVQRVAISAINAISCFEGREPELILITKLSSTSSVEIIGACLKGLININSKNIDMVGQYLYSNDIDIQIEAAFVLAEFRSIESYKLLRTAWQNRSISKGDYGYILRAISALRIPQSKTFLKLIQEEDIDVYSEFAKNLLKEMG